MRNSPEDGLLSAARSRDAAAFDALIADHLQPAYRLAFNLLGDTGQAEDAVQESALKAWRAIRRLKDGAAFRPWFFRIVVNQCNSMRRSRWWSILPIPLGQSTGSEQASAIVAGVDIDRALAKLPSRDRLALYAFFYLDWPMEAVSRLLGCSEGAARTRVSRAARRLRPELTEGDL